MNSLQSSLTTSSYQDPIEYPRGRIPQNYPKERKETKNYLITHLLQISYSTITEFVAKLHEQNKFISKGPVTIERMIVKVQATIRGRAVRRVVILPRQITWLMPGEGHLATLFCRSIRKLACLSLSSQYKEGELYVFKGNQDYPSANYLDLMEEWAKKKEARKPYLLREPIRVEVVAHAFFGLMRNNSHITVFFSQLQKGPIGSGKNKVIYPMKKITIYPRCIENGIRGGHTQDLVYIKARDKNSISIIEHGIKQNRLIASILSQGVYCTAPVEVHQGPQNMLLEQRRYRSSLDKALFDNSVPASLEDPLATIPFTFFDRLKTILDVSRCLEQMHRSHIVHRDVKPQNILVEVDQHKTFSGHLSDFDLSVIGSQKSAMVSDYAFWDPSCRKGWITPFCDIYGLAIILSECIFPEFTRSVLWKGESIDKLPFKNLIGKVYLDSALEKLSNNSIFVALRQDFLGKYLKIHNILEYLAEKKSEPWHRTPENAKIFKILDYEIHVVCFIYDLIVLINAGGNRLLAAIEREESVQKVLTFGHSEEKNKMITDLLHKLNCITMCEIRHVLEQFVAAIPK